MGEVVAKLAGVGGGYSKKVEVMSAVDAIFRAGELTAIVGPNGAGKSTLLKALQNALPYQTGEIELCGERIGNYTPRQIARLVGRAYATVERYDMTVSQFCMLGRTARRSIWALTDSKEDVAAVGEAMQLAGIEGLKARRIRTLSDGERQLAGLAMALAQQPRLLLLDEPTANLDPKNRKMVMQVVREVATSRQRMATVATVHNIENVLRWADNVIMMREGKVLYSGPTQETINEVSLQETYGVQFEKLTDVQGDTKGYAVV